MELTEERLREGAGQAADLWDGALSAMPEEEPAFSAQFERRMNRLLRTQRRTPKLQQLFRTTRRAAILFLCLGLGALTVTMSVEALRVRFFDVVTKITEEFTEYRYRSDVLEIDSFVPEEPAYIPTGMKLENREDGENYVYRYYEAEDGSCVDYHQVYVDGLTYGYDSEDAESESITLKDGTEATFVSEDGWNQLIWTNWDSQFVVMGNIEKNEMVKMAESVVSKK